MGNCDIRIERNRNGYEVTVTDPEVVKKNNINRGEGVVWQSPHREYQFATKQQVMKFVDKVFDQALPADEYNAAFDKAAKESMK